MNKQLLTFNGRPCIIIGGGRKAPTNPKWRAVRFQTVKFLDGAQPAQENVPAGRLKSGGKKMRPGEVLIWGRVADLTDQGMAFDRAKQQATDELAKGILADRPF